MTNATTLPSFSRKIGFDATTLELKRSALSQQKSIQECEEDPSAPDPAKAWNPASTRGICKGIVVLAMFLAMFSHCVSAASGQEGQLLPIPDGLVVLTFDDGNRSDLEFSAPILKEYGFGATFYITDGHFYKTDKKHFLTWKEVQELHEQGFEIGNHTRSHPNLTTLSAEVIGDEVDHIEKLCRKQGIPKPVTFCYPGYHVDRKVLDTVARRGLRFARRGVEPEFPYTDNGDRGPIYDPAIDHPLMIPTTGASGPNWGLADLAWAVEQARDGKIAVLTFHCVDDEPVHPWVNTKREDFKRYMKYLHDHECTVIALRDLAKYVDPARRPGDPFAGIKARLAKKKPAH